MYFGAVLMFVVVQGTEIVIYTPHVPTLFVSIHITALSHFYARTHEGIL